MRVSDTLAVGLLGDNDSRYQAVIENDNENRSQTLGRPKPQPGETGAIGLGAGDVVGDAGLLG
jgi:hypothetical protein